jgi:cytochrome P450
MNATTTISHGLPIVGHLFDFGRDPIGFLLRLQRELGDAPTFSMGGSNITMLAHPDDVETALLETGRRFEKGYTALGGFSVPRLLGNGLVTSEGDFWKRQRKLSQPAFHAARIGRYAETMVHYTERMVAEWRDGQKRDAHEDMMMLTQAIVAKALFDADVTGDAQEVGRLLNDFLDGAARETRSIQMMMPAGWMTPTRRRVDAVVHGLERSIFRIIEERRSSSAEHADLLGMLMAARDDDGQAMSDTQLRDEIMTLYLAGHETTANTLSWTWFELARRPDVRERFEAELATVLGGRSPTPEDLRSLPFTNAIVDETLRMYPAAWMFARRATEDVDLRGTLIPRGRMVWISPYVLQHDARWFPDPERFDPARWLDGRTAGMHKYAYIPFGGGPRICIGNGFAKMEAALILAGIAQHFRLDVTDPSAVALDPTLTLRPRNGVPVTLRSR